MPTLEENLQVWDRDHPWSARDEDWSSTWGNSATQWHGTLFPRIRFFLPCEHILEIAPGFGRWTVFLKDHCRRLTAVDLSERCIAHCRERFRDAPQVHLVLNDGKSLAAIPDHSVDFAFSFDSLVHVEADVLEGYVDQLSRKLAREGAAFIHHSNAHIYRCRFAPGRRLPLRWRHRLMRWRLLPRDHLRAGSVSAARIADFCRRVGLRCIGQELVNWGSIRDLDCFSVFTPAGSRWDRECRTVSNPYFLSEARSFGRASRVYSPPTALGAGGIRPAEPPAV